MMPYLLPSSLHSLVGGTFNCLVRKYRDWGILTRCLNTGIIVVRLKMGSLVRRPNMTVGAILDFFVHGCIFTLIFPQYF